MSDNQKYRVYPDIHNAEELGIAVLGNRFTEVVPRVAPIDRADYGRALARLQGGIFTSKGYIVPDNGENTGLGA
ncbi:hypothetical protein FACS1894202_03890 [Clostridia bacterium]|nr:hypothetical protein FACS1894202_03890 [Clostridia bacterium]